MLDMLIPVREVPTTALRNYQQRIQGRFLKGPIPLPDIAEAAKLPGQALGVYLAIHHRAALTRSDSVTLPKELLEQFGVSRDSKARSLRALEMASLIAVERGKGRTARITLRSSTQHTSIVG
jgi:DNA-binding MarR family transcriptional regulator